MFGGLLGKQLVDQYLLNSRLLIESLLFCVSGRDSFTLGGLSRSGESVANGSVRGPVIEVSGGSFDGRPVG